MILKLKRRFLGDTYTIGSLFVDNEYFSDTLEDKVRDINKNGIFDGKEKKVYSETAIPYGKYRVILSYSPKFKRVLPEILNVPSFTGIRIHRGNTAKDSAGCILLGFNRKKGMVLDSTKCEIKIVELIKQVIDKGEEVTLEII